MTKRLQLAEEELVQLPGGALVLAGMKEIDRTEPAENALLVLVASPRLRRLGFDIPERPDIRRPYEHRLYELLESTHGSGAYSRYNSLLRRIDSFCHALEQRVGRRAG